MIQGALVQEGVEACETLSFVGALTVAFIAIRAIPNARIIQATGAQTPGIAGVFLLRFGEVLSGWTTKNFGGVFATAEFLMVVRTR